MVTWAEAGAADSSTIAPATGMAPRRARVVYLDMDELLGV
jgi:hypothetical protein